MATAKQIAARKKFAERARSGELARMRKKSTRKSNPTATRAASRKANPIYDEYGFQKFQIYTNGMISYDYGIGFGYEDTGYSVFQKKDKTEVYDRFTEKYVEMPKNRYSLALPSKRDEFLNDLMAVTKIENLRDRDNRSYIEQQRTSPYMRKKNPTATRAPARSRTKLMSTGERKKNPMAPAVNVSSDSNFKYAVEAKRYLASGGSVFETIAAFHTKAQAQDYAKAILANHPTVTLRVKTYGGRAK